MIMNPYYCTSDECRLFIAAGWLPDIGPLPFLRVLSLFFLIVKIVFITSVRLFVRTNLVLMLVIRKSFTSQLNLFKMEKFYIIKEDLH